MGPRVDSRTNLPLGAASFYILVALADGDRHGYSIIKEVENATGGEIKLLPGTLYRLVKQMLADEWLSETSGDPDDDQRRRTYRLTALGRDVARAEAQRLEHVVRMARAARLLPA